MDAPFYTVSELTTDEAAERDRVLGALTEATRRLADAQLRTEVELDEAAAVTAELEALTKRLLVAATDGALGTQLGPAPGEFRNHGNAVVGLRNALAPLSAADRDVTEDKHVRFSMHLGAGFEGAPGLVHGGISALILDQLLGEAAAVGGGPGMTGRLTIHYRRPTPLGDLHTEAWLESTAGRKSTVRGHIKDADGQVTVEAEGLFILPSWATEHPEWKQRGRTFE